ncbi:hypothetical protein P43SY_000206 [Pythium insidiosum]|uniref:Protein phosphatase n=1 Tax=Pythium insidiosum TaxID=114742 RepID=A0AAD5QEA5_PYTIN|nr:hypothetical protein ATCC90586_011237 [Pythium insidiosum]KAJ0408002.1 hypothetical protein P43SY_000206 [Pythium insidiosum]
MNAAHYIIARMRSCKSPTDVVASTSTPRKSGSRPPQKNCFSSVGSAQHTYHGDDAVGYGPGYMVVADGVSGTAKASGVLARLLVSETLSMLGKLKKRARDHPVKASEFCQYMQIATKNARKTTRRKGRLDSTISAVFFDEPSQQMHVYTIGDCKCVLLRNGKVVFESDSIIYDFNVPAVVSSNQTINYTSDVHIQTCKYEPGDVCLLFSDGVHDNLFVDQVVECVQSHTDNAEQIATKTMEVAVQTFTECNDYIPFAVSAAGFCREAVEELKTNTAIDQEEYEKFRDKCANIPAFEITRPMFSNEKRVRHLAFYSASNLLAFAHKKLGKRDDVSVCAAVLA